MYVTLVVIQSFKKNIIYILLTVILNFRAYIYIYIYNIYIMSISEGLISIYFM